MWDAIFSSQPASVKGYTDKSIEVVRELNARVLPVYGEQVQPLVLVVVAGDGPSLYSTETG